MSFFEQIFSNRILLSAVIGWAVAQSIKVTIGVIKKKRFDFRWFVGAGGMPSSHASGVVAMATSVGFKFGFDSSIFAIVLVFTMIIMFDAQGFRRAAGKQAEVLNRIMEDIQYKRKVGEDRLIELLGHTPFEVLAGALVGVLVSIFFFR